MAAAESVVGWFETKLNNWGSRWWSSNWYLNAQWVWSCTIGNFTSEKSSSVSGKGWTLISNLHHNWNLLHRPPLLMRFSFCFQEPRKWHSCMHWQPPRQQASSPVLVAMDNLHHVDVPDQPGQVSYTKTGHGAAAEMTSSLDTSEFAIKKELKVWSPFNEYFDEAKSTLLANIPSGRTTQKQTSMKICLH